MKRPTQRPPRRSSRRPRSPVRSATAPPSSIDGKIVYFGGVEGEVVLGMVGSRQHVVGLQGEDIMHGPLASGLTSAVLQTMEASLAAVMDASEDPGTGSAVHSKQHGPLLHSAEDEKALEIVSFASRNLNGPTQNLEFLAKRLLLGKLGAREHVLLGTPLYVALAD